MVLFAGSLLAAPSVQVRLPAAPARFLYDEPGLLSGDERAAIEDSLMKFDKQGIEIGVAIFSTIHGDPIEDVSIALAEKWRPGREDRDNGLLLVVALEERAMRIEVGYGLEGVVPDAIAGRIIQYDMTPAFREGRFGDGITKAISNLARAARGEAIPEPQQVTLPAWFPLIFIIIMLVFMIAVRRASRRARTLSRMGRRARNSSWWWGPGGFGGFGGGGFGGGGGGFGGGGGSFGGGSFGGGGASGRW
ncbi:MAG TPA: TPM domain-containing protein [Candidatus Krumholzibacteria bacterium]